MVLLLVASAVAQSDTGIESDIGNPGLNGKNTIQGHIYYPSGRPLDKRVRVRVSSVRSGISTVMTDDNGALPCNDCGKGLTT